MGIETAIIGGALIGGVASSRAAKQQQKGYDAATAEQARQYDQTREDFAPWRDTGRSALDRLGRASTGDFSDFTASPSYEFVRDEGQRNMGNSFAARGGAFSGNALRALTEFNQNLASTEYGNWWNRQAGLAGVGQSATQSTAQAGQNAANNIASNYIGAGNARASGVMGMNDAIQGGIGNWAYYRGLAGGNGGGVSYSPSGVPGLDYVNVGIPYRK